LSDISLTFTWWQIALWVLATWFWPLTGAAVLAAFWLWRKPASWIARIAGAIVFICWVLSGGTLLMVAIDRARTGAQYESELRARQTKVQQSAVVAGIRLPAETVVTHAQNDPSDIVAVDVPVPIQIHGVPVTGHVPLDGGLLSGDVTLARDAIVDEVPCSAQQPIRMDSGKLVTCRMSRPSRVRGIPCSGDVDLQVGVVCVLVADYSRFGYTWRAQTKVTDFGDMVWFNVGSRPPSLYVFGSLLAAGTTVQFQNGRIVSIDLQGKPAHFEDCTIDLIMVQNGVVGGRNVGDCRLPPLPTGLYVKLPPSVLQSH
jgi:hypothetical protein